MLYGGLHRLSEAQWRGRDVPQATTREPGVYNNVAPPGARVAAIVGVWRSCKIAVGGGARVWVAYIAAIAYVARIVAIGGGQKRTHGVCVLALGGDM